MMILKTTILALFALPLAAAKMRGAITAQEEMFPTRQLMENMGGGGCPDPSVSTMCRPVLLERCVPNPFAFAGIIIIIIIIITQPPSPLLDIIIIIIIIIIMLYYDKTGSPGHPLHQQRRLRR
jgi:hypothetical protein